MLEQVTCLVLPADAVSRAGGLAGDYVQGGVKPRTGGARQAGVPLEGEPLQRERARDYPPKTRFWHDPRREGESGAAFISQCFFQVVSQKSIPPQICQLILNYY